MEETLTLNNREFLVVNKLNYNNNNYIYVIATDGTNDIAFLKETLENGISFVESITDEEELKSVANLIVEKANN